MKRAELLASLDIGACVKRLREMKGLSQEELAKGICDRTNITKLENGHSKIPSLSFVLLICDRLEMTIEEFLNYSLSNSYCLDRKFILDALMNNKFNNLKEYLESINQDYLSKKDKKYYSFLVAKVAIYESNNSLAKQILTDITCNCNNPIEDSIDLLSYHELIKNELIKVSLNVKNNIYSRQRIEDMMTKKSSDELLYFINDLILISLLNNDKKSMKYLLAKELQFINIHETYKYLVNYYKNKIALYKEDDNVANEIKRKLFAIEKNSND